jgi:hypothetical protein
MLVPANDLEEEPTAMSDPGTVDSKTQEKIDAVLRQLDTDEEFRRQLIRDPGGALQAAGIPAEISERARVVRDEDPSEEVSGYTKWTVGWKCWINPDGSKECLYF